MEIRVLAARFIKMFLHSGTCGTTPMASCLTIDGCMGKETNCVPIKFLAPRQMEVQHLKEVIAISRRRLFVATEE